MNVGSLLSESARHRLKRLFKRLDVDQDGYFFLLFKQKSISEKFNFSHLTYTQVQRCLPSNLSRAQVTFFRVVCQRKLKSHSMYNTSRSLVVL